MTLPWHFLDTFLTLFQHILTSWSLFELFSTLLANISKHSQHSLDVSLTIPQYNLNTFTLPFSNFYDTATMLPRHFFDTFYLNTFSTLSPTLLPSCNTFSLLSHYFLNTFPAFSKHFFQHLPYCFPTIYLQFIYSLSTIYLPCLNTLATLFHAYPYFSQLFLSFLIAFSTPYQSFLNTYSTHPQHFQISISIASQSCNFMLVL